MIIREGNRIKIQTTPYNLNKDYMNHDDDYFVEVGCTVTIKRYPRQYTLRFDSMQITCPRKSLASKHLVTLTIRGTSGDSTKIHRIMSLLTSNINITENVLTEFTFTGDFLRDGKAHPAFHFDLKVEPYIEGGTPNENIVNSSITYPLYKLVPSLTPYPDALEEIFRIDARERATLLVKPSQDCFITIKVDSPDEVWFLPQYKIKAGMINKLNIALPQNYSGKVYYWLSTSPQFRYSDRMIYKNEFSYDTRIPDIDFVSLYEITSPETVTLDVNYSLSIFTYSSNPDVTATVTIVPLNENHTTLDEHKHIITDIVLGHNYCLNVPILKNHKGWYKVTLQRDDNKYISIVNDILIDSRLPSTNLVTIEPYIGSATYNEKSHICLKGVATCFHPYTFKYKFWCDHFTEKGHRVTKEPDILPGSETWDSLPILDFSTTQKVELSPLYPIPSDRICKVRLWRCDEPNLYMDIDVRQPLHYAYVKLSSLPPQYLSNKNNTATITLICSYDDTRTRNGEADRLEIQYKKSTDRNYNTISWDDTPKINSRVSKSFEVECGYTYDVRVRSYVEHYHPTTGQLTCTSVTTTTPIKISTGTSSFLFLDGCWKHVTPYVFDKVTASWKKVTRYIKTS